MFCKMDVDDNLLPDPREYRLRGCKCVVDPGPPLVEYGCICTSCDTKCRKCPGFGYAKAPEKRFYQILSRARSVIRRKVRTCGRTPGYLRLSNAEVRVLIRKRNAEDPDHWINECFEVGPPVRIYDVIVVVDRRKR